MGNLVLSGATSGSTTLTPTDAVTATLTLPSSTGTLLSTANPQSGGVIQVVSVPYNTTATTTSSSAVSSGLTASITPKFSTSKILVIATMGDQSTQTQAVGVSTYLYRNGSQIGASFFGSNQMYFAGTTLSYNIGASQTINYVDSPATTSSTTYAIYFASKGGGSTATLFRDSTVGSITLMEIAA